MEESEATSGCSLPNLKITEIWTRKATSLSTVHNSCFTTNVFAACVFLRVCLRSECTYVCIRNTITELCEFWKRKEKHIARIVCTE